MELSITLFAKRRMENRGLTEAHVKFIIEHCEESYTNKGRSVRVATLPDGRTGKVQIDASRGVVDAFTFAASADEGEKC